MTQRRLRVAVCSFLTKPILMLALSMEIPGENQARAELELEVDIL
jgi:hypothetical protein